MIYKTAVLICLLNIVDGNKPKPYTSEPAKPTIKKCLTGYMTDIQSWVNADGTLSSSIGQRNALDLSNKLDAVPLLLEQFDQRQATQEHVKFLSMANCGLRGVPQIFSCCDSSGLTLGQTVEYLSFYGNNFQLSSSTGQQYDVFMNATEAREVKIELTTPRIHTSWSNGFNNISFTRLKELDLRACSINILESHVFAGMANLESLYLGENSITYIDANAFNGLTNLIHLDLSRNIAYDENGILKYVVFETMDIFRDLPNMESLDLSYTKLTQRNNLVLRSLSPKMQRLSLCYCSLTRLREDAFKQTAIKYLDVSGNSEILSHPKSLRGLEGTLRVLYAEETAMKMLEALKHFRKLEILKLTNNEITVVPRHIAETLRNLQVLDLDRNRIITWFERHVYLMSKLRFLSLRENNINMISEDMVRDMANVSFVGLSKNFIICNCNARDIYELAWRNEILGKGDQMPIAVDDPPNGRSNFHRGFQEYNDLIIDRRPLVRVCDGSNVCDVNLKLNTNGRLLLFDYTPADYQCLLVSEDISTGFENFPSCSQEVRGKDQFEDLVRSNTNWLYFLIVPALLLPALVFLFVSRSKLKYFLITMRNSAMLSLISKNESPDESTIFNYDVFVSYCNEDRAWVLDQLLPHVERDCNISVCLHERDFQVGLTILENIVSCMDRSRSIMLILSQRFLLSQWCQFEMHLAQHRLLETRREDLILILLEEIPRRLRPNTLHYLMLTKTYIVWPKAEGERIHFWKRLKKSLVTQKQKHTENVSLA